MFAGSHRKMTMRRTVPLTEIASGPGGVARHVR
jgi:hypothetical protein